MAEAQDVETLKRRGRRRLVGAVALVLAAVIVLPMVFDPEPKHAPAPVSVRIPGENDKPFAPKVTPKAPERKVEEVPAEEKKAEAPRVAEKKPEPAKKAEPAAEYVVQVGVFSDPKSAIAKLSAARVPYYTERTPEKLTRVRAGPFASRAAAEKALERLKGLGLQPGAVATKAG
jgi:DedD protein